MSDQMVRTVSGAMADSTAVSATTVAGLTSHGYDIFTDRDSQGATRLRTQCHDEPPLAEAGACSGARPSGRPVTRLLIVGWDRTRSAIMVGLLLLLVLWAAIFFPLIV